MHVENNGKIIEGLCDKCMEYCSDLTECPEHCHEVKRNHLFDDHLCKECCKEYLDEKECCMSCGKNFIEQYFIEKLGDKCEEFGLTKYEKLKGYTDKDNQLLIIFNKHINFKSKQDVEIDSPLIVDEDCIIKYDNEIYNYKTRYFNRLYDLLKYEFEEYISFSLVFAEDSDGDVKPLLKMSGEMVSGFLAPNCFEFFEKQDEFESRIKNLFIGKQKVIDTFEIEKKIEKYCTIPQDYCNKPIKHQGKDSYFIAYPFTDKYSRFVSRLKSKLKDKGMDVILPIEENDAFPNTGILFCKICEMIHSTNFMICEITEINQNVMFEAGYAMGLGKDCHFIVDKSYDKSKRHELDLIGDQQMIYYIDEDGCAKDFTLKEENRSHYLPIRPCQFENKYLTESKNNKDKILLLFPEVEKYQKIEAEIKNNLNSKYEFSDTDKVAGHKFMNYQKNILESKYVIGILLSDTYEQKELKNSKISFLLGFSLALGKKTLIFQEKPAKKKIIDFKNLSREFIDKEDLRKAITTFFSNQDS